MESDAQVNLTLTEDLYVDLNGFDLSGTIITNGYSIYGMDSTTNTYTCNTVGYFACVDENGNTIVPVRHFKTDAAMTGAIRRYMAIETENGYSFHRFYLGVVTSNLYPVIDAVGYTAVFYGDHMVVVHLNAENAFGYTLQLDGYNPISVYKTADEFLSGKTVRLRINNYDVENFGETQLFAQVTLQLADGTLIQSSVKSNTLRNMMETVNADYTKYIQPQLAALKEMIERHPVMKTWNIWNIYYHDGEVDIPEVENPDGDPLA